MTRFARAKGSKSSNEKKPEDATSWSEMKNSMLIKKISEVRKSPPEKEMERNTPKPTEWAPLGDSFGDLLSFSKQDKGKENKKINKTDCSSSTEVKNKKKKMKRIDDSEKESTLIVHDKSVTKKKDIKQKSSVSEEVGSEKDDVKVKKKNRKRKFQEDVDSQMLLITKKKKNSKDSSNCEVQNVKQKDKNLTNMSIRQFNKKKMMKSKSLKDNSQFKMGNGKKFDKKFNKQSKEKKKIRNKNFEDKSSSVEELIINGEKIPIVKFQGFNVTLEDAERLKKLKSEMVKQGIPKAKLEAAIKLERRRAEKVLSRLKKSVCFHCRGRGHLLSYCPNLTEKDNTSTGICYKCGSTEHSAVECKVIKGTNFQFAECFICKEQGHIARQCPDNPRGLYPHGGACRECGDVTHLRKDCPQVQAQKAEEVVTVGVRNERALECLDEEIGNREKQNLKKKTKKSSVVKF